MITEIPTADELRQAGLNLLFLAWAIAVEPDIDFMYAEYNGFDGDPNAVAEYWKKAQPQLGNAFSLIEQAMELALKGQIAAVSPYLLISRDPKTWPANVDTAPVPFSAFHTIDAADLVKVHNTVAAVPLSDELRTFFDDVRRQRNALMHSVAKQSFELKTLFRNLLTAAAYLFNDKPWAAHVLDHSESSSRFVIGANYDHARNDAMHEVESAIRHLEAADAKRFFGFDKKRRSYLCPTCRDAAYTKGGYELPRLAQLATKTKGETKLRCILCDKSSDVQRSPCDQQNCRGDVIGDEMCLTCCCWQNNLFSEAEASLPIGLD